MAGQLKEVRKPDQFQAKYAADYQGNENGKRCQFRRAQDAILQ